MPNLHLLLSSLNTYPSGIASLSGCHNDTEAFQQYFTEVQQDKDWSLNEIRLQDDQVTRQNLQKAFAQFAEADSDDRCVWVHSGHGTRVPCHPAFYHMNPDRKHRALVVYNEHGGVDFLLDKELSWLLWSATRKEGQSVVVITDTCFSGSNMRQQGDVERLVPDQTPEVKPLEDYLGHKDYTDVGNGSYTPPRGNYLQLSASEMHQPALERRFFTGVQGVFSFALLSELRTCGRALSYLELYHRVKARVEGMTQYQIPKLDYTAGFNTRQFFLSRQLDHRGTTHYVYYDRQQRVFILNAGSIVGLTKGSGASPSAWVVKDGVRHPLELTDIGPGSSTVAAHSLLSKSELTAVQLAEGLGRKMLVAFAEDFPQSKVAAIKESLTLARTEYLQLVDDPAAASYWIRMSPAGKLGLHVKNDFRALFKKRKTEKPHLFWEQVDRVGRWKYLSTLQNPQTRLSERDLKITIRKYEIADNPKFNEGYEETDWQEGLNLAGAYVENYEYSENGYRDQAFACGVRNISTRPLYVRALLLSNDYSIHTTVLSPTLVLAPGESTWLQAPFEDHGLGIDVDSPVLRIEIGEVLRQYGTTYNHEQLVLLAATEEVSVANFTQSGMEPDRDLTPRLRGDGSQITTTRDAEETDDQWANTQIDQPDWTTFHVPITVTQYLDSQEFGQRQASHRFLAPRGCTGFASLLCLQSAARHLPYQETYQWFSPYLDLTPYGFTHGFHRAPGQNVLLLYGMKGIEQVSSEQPFSIVLPPEEADRVADITPMGWQVDGQLAPLPFSRAGLTLQLHALPEVRELVGINQLLRPKGWQPGELLPEERGCFVMLAFLGSDLAS